MNPESSLCPFSHKEDGLCACSIWRGKQFCLFSLLSASLLGLPTFCRHRSETPTQQKELEQPESHSIVSHWSSGLDVPELSGDGRLSPWAFPDPVSNLLILGVPLFPHQILQGLWCCGCSVPHGRQNGSSRGRTHMDPISVKLCLCWGISQSTACVVVWALYSS